MINKSPYLIIRRFGRNYIPEQRDRGITILPVSLFIPAHVGPGLFLCWRRRHLAELGDFEWRIVRGEAVITKWENEEVIIPPTDLLLCYHDYTAIWECIVWGLFNSTYQLRRSDRGKLSVCASRGCEQLVFGKLKKFCGSKCKNRTNVALWRANNNQQ